MDREAPFHQALDHRPARCLDRHADLIRRTRRTGHNPVRHFRQPLAAMLERPLAEQLPGNVDYARLVRLRSPVDTHEPCQLHIEPPICRISRARQRCLPVPVLALCGANSPRGIHRWLNAGAQVLFRCSRHRDPAVAPGGLPDSARLPARSHSERYRDPSVGWSSGRVPINAFSSVERGPSGSVGRP